jgi:O-antigen chain-terminating methyltransferase
VSGQPLDDLLARLERERLQADQRYQDALTAVDRAVQVVPGLPEPPAPFDAARVATLNQSWRVLPDPPVAPDRSLRGRLREFIWRLLRPPLEAQQAFNAALVDHLNRNEAGARQLPERVAALIALLRRELELVVRFESLLVQYLQAITAYVDTKDRRLGGGDLQARLELAERRVLALQRELERPAQERGQSAASAPTEAPASGRIAGGVGATDYVGFEDRFRGSSSEIRRRAEEYASMLASVSDVLDVGCGRGELLSLLRAKGVRARGVDTNKGMVDLCLEQGLDAEVGDAVGYLERQPDASLGGLVAIQVVEHFEPPYLARFLECAYRVLRPGAPIVLETINPACWTAFFECYLRDLTHQRALHPDTLRFLVQAAGFGGADVRYRQPVAESDRLQRADAGGGSADLLALAAAVNDHADKLNGRLFSWMDYAVVARR